MERKKTERPRLILPASAYPNLSEKQREEGSEVLRRYLEVCLRQWERRDMEKKYPGWGQRD